MLYIILKKSGKKVKIRIQTASFTKYQKWILDTTKALIKWLKENENPDLTIRNPDFGYTLCAPKLKMISTYLV